MENTPFLKRVFTDGEIQYCFKRRTPQKHLAGRFAAKEACLKALGTGLSGGVTWTDIEVVNTNTGRPELKLHSTVRKNFPPRKKIFLSISYSSEFALALVAIG
ncbi:MAG: holo-[acyl-carrier-protein] synthase [Thermodesulfobacteriota bacterium]|nr:MAG: holo-[acyl-carrier-protein] synthase [Thermodesulfobacteriota bacterium]